MVAADDAACTTPHEDNTNNTTHTPSLSTPTPQHHALDVTNRGRGGGAVQAPFEGARQVMWKGKQRLQQRVVGEAFLPPPSSLTNPPSLSL